MRPFANCSKYRDRVKELRGANHFPGDPIEFSLAALSTRCLSCDQLSARKAFARLAVERLT